MKRRVMAMAGALTALAFPVAARAQVALGVLGEGTYVQHRVDAGSGAALSSGTLFGGRVALNLGRSVELSGAGAVGSLTADSAQAENADLSRGEATLTLLPVQWLGIRIGGQAHSFSNAVAVQRWTAARVGGEGRLRFSGGRIAGVVRFDFFPVVSVSGLERPDRAFSAASGITLRSGVITAAFGYHLERYDFPEVAGVARKEQITYVTGSLGLALGRARP